MDQVIRDLRKRVTVRTANSVVSIMTLSSITMAVFTAGAAVWGYNILLFRDWILLGMLAAGAVFGIYSLNQKRQVTKIDTYCLAALISGALGLFWAEVALFTSAEVISIVLWSEAIVVMASFIGLLFPHVFQRRSLLVILLTGLLLLVMGFEESVFGYLSQSDAVMYQMSWLGWTGVIIFLVLMFLSWHEAMQQADPDHAIVASAGPIVNCVELF
jgi:hypothetical protein